MNIAIRPPAPVKRRTHKPAKLFHIAARLSEAQIQRSVLRWLRAVLPMAIVAHVGNGGTRNPAEAANLKRLGVTAGFPDLICILPAGKTIFFEVKREGGRTSPAQAEFHAALDHLGHIVATIRSIDDAREVLIQHEIEMRGA